MIIQASVDSWVNEAATGRNYGDNTKITLSGQSSAQKLGLIFVPRPFADGAQIDSAILRVHVEGDWSGSRTVTARRVNETWKQNRVDWGTRPNRVDGNLAAEAVSGLADQDLIEFDVTAMLQDVSNGDPYHGFGLSISTNPDHKLYSSEHPDPELWPELEIEWTEAPDPPNGLSPDGGTAVTAAKPYVTWDFRDISDEGIQAHSRVQFDTTDDFASPVYDTGQVANVGSNFPTSTTGAVTNWASGMTASTTYYWRVMVWDDSGQASEWSDTAETMYVSPGTLTLNNPAAGGSPYVEDVTPLIAWTLSGATQAMARVILAEQNRKGGWEEIWRMPREVTTATTVTVPEKLIHSKRKDGVQARYRITVDTWDNTERQGTPGNPAYRRVEREFVYTRVGTPTAVTGLNAVADGYFVNLTWSRTTMPDYFSIRVDDREVEPRVPPNDVLVSGTNYAMTWCRARGGVEQTYEVEAVTTGVGHSDGNSTDTATTTPYGIVFIDETDVSEPVYVVMRGIDGPGFAIGQTGETFRLHGSRKPVRIVDSVGGYEGQVTGRIMSREDKDTFEQLLGTQPGTELRLAVADINVPVVLGDVTLTPLADVPSEGMWTAEVEVFQVGEFTIDLT